MRCAAGVTAVPSARTADGSARQSRRRWPRGGRTRERSRRDGAEPRTTAARAPSWALALRAPSWALAFRATLLIWSTLRSSFLIWSTLRSSLGSHLYRYSHRPPSPRPATLHRHRRRRRPSHRAGRKAQSSAASQRVPATTRPPSASSSEVSTPTHRDQSRSGRVKAPYRA